MAIVAQEITDDRISITATDGTVFEYSSAEAAKAGSPEAAREAIYAAVQQVMSDHIWERCLHVGIDEQFRFTDLTVYFGSPDSPPPPQEISIAKGGDIEIVAFDGQSHAISVAEIKQTGDVKAAIESKLAELLTVEASGKYAVEVAVDEKGDITDLKAGAVEATVEATDVVVDAGGLSP